MPTHRRSRARHAAWALVVLLVGIAGVAEAHADLVRAQPAPFSEIADAPSVFVLEFSEPLEDTYTGADVVGPDGVTYSEGSRVDPARRTRLLVDVAPLPDGIISVQWRTLSVDTHTKTGSYILALNASFGGVDSVSIDPHAGHRAASAASVAEAAVRGVGFIGAALAFGVPAFVLLVRPVPPRFRTEALLLAAVGALVAAVCAGALLVAIGARIGGGVVHAFDTSTGRMVAMRGAAFLVAALPLAWLARRPTTDVRTHAALLIAPGLGLAFTSASSHAAAKLGARGVLMTLDFLHQSAVGLWVGGVAALLLLTTRHRAEPATVGAWVLRFHPVARLAVAVAVATGMYAAAVHLGGPQALVGSVYGGAVLTKIVLVVVLLAFGAHHVRLAQRRLTRHDDATYVLRRALRWEAMTMVVILLAAGVLANTAPPAGGIAAAGPATSEPGAEPFHAFTDKGHAVEVHLRPSPPVVGAANLTVVVQSQAEPLPDGASAGFTFRPPSDPFGEGKTVRSTAWGADRWTMEGPYFTEAGTWKVTVFVQGRGVFVSDTFEVVVGAPGGGSPTSS